LLESNQQSCGRGTDTVAARGESNKFRLRVEPTPAHKNKRKIINSEAIKKLEDRMKVEMKLPRAIETYLRAINFSNADRFVSSFAEHAVIKGLGPEIRGIAAIKEWADREIFPVNVTLEVNDVAERDGQTMLTVTVGGAFDQTALPGPLLMSHSFTVIGEKIACLDLSRNQLSTVCTALCTSTGKVAVGSI